MKILLLSILNIFIMNIAIAQPEWLDKTAYPFESNFLDLPEGKLHYIDEGEGEVILFVHGTPAWSFLYRNHIKELSKKYRCIALDHLGFGLSDKPMDFAGRPEDHSRNLSILIKHLGIESFTLVVHDFGGPIGLSYAIAHPKKIERIVLFNTWLWETASDKNAQRVNSFLHGVIGKFIYLNTNFSPKYLLKSTFYNKKKINKKIHQQYYKPFPNKKSRYGLWNIGKSLVGSSDWYEAQWKQIDKIKDKPFLVLWGTKDKLIKEDNLEKWTSVLTNKTICKYDAGHFVQEEVPEETIQKITKFVKH